MGSCLLKEACRVAACFLKSVGPNAPVARDKTLGCRCGEAKSLRYRGYSGAFPAGSRAGV